VDGHVFLERWLVVREQALETKKYLQIKIAPARQTKRRRALESQRNFRVCDLADKKRTYRLSPAPGGGRHSLTLPSRHMARVSECQSSFLIASLGSFVGYDRLLPGLR